MVSRGMKNLDEKPAPKRESRLEAQLRRSDSTRNFWGKKLVVNLVMSKPVRMTRDCRKAQVQSEWKNPDFKEEPPKSQKVKKTQVIVSAKQRQPTVSDPQTLLASKQSSKPETPKKQESSKNIIKPEPIPINTKKPSN